MDRETILKHHLEQAERQVTSGECHIVEQRKRIALLGGGPDRVAAIELLTSMETIQVTHTTNRDRLCRQLDRLASGR
jgi:hypothetical protein